MLSLFENTAQCVDLLKKKTVWSDYSLIYKI